VERTIRGGKTTRSILGMALALFVIFTSSGYLMYTWGSAVGYYLLVTIGSFLGGMVMGNVERSLKIFSITFVSGFISFVLLGALPAVLHGENYAGEVNAIVGIIATEFAKVIIVSFPVSVFACLFGCFLGNSLLENE